MRGLGLTLGMCVLMVESIAGSTQSVYLIDMAFRENGKLLIAGRAPVYGMERPNIENAPGSAPGKDVRYFLAPIPLKFPSATHTSDFQFDLFPSLAARTCTLDVEVTLTSSPAALGSWLWNGIPEEWMRSKAGDVEEGRRAWTPELAGVAPDAFKVVLARYSGAGIANRLPVDSVELVPEQTEHLRLELPMPHGTTKIAFEMPGLNLWLGLGPINPAKTVWPRGTPAALAEGKEPIEAAQAKKKFSSWKFWQRGG